MNSKVKKICINGIIAAAYCALSYLFLPISFGPIQVRIAESLCLLCFFRREYSIGITIGCILANLYSAFTLTPLDLLFGTLASFVSCLLVSFSKHLGIAMLFPIIINPLLVGAEFIIIGTSNAYWWMVGMIMIGEATIIVISYILYLFIMKKDL